MRIPVLVITGPVGVGKSSVLAEIEDILKTTDMRFGAIELDALSYCWPPTADDDRFRSKLTLKNLAAVWRNFRAAGAERLFLSQVVESRDQLDRYRRAIPGAQITVVRLRAKAATLRKRIDQREIGLGRAWHHKRAVELARLMDDAGIGDVLVDTDGRSVNAIAKEVLKRTGWLATPRARPPVSSRGRPRRAPSRRSGG